MIQTNALKEARTNKGFTLRQVSEQAGISVRMLQYLERGEREPSFGTARALSEMLSVPIDELF